MTIERVVIRVELMVVILVIMRVLKIVVIRGIIVLVTIQLMVEKCHIVF